METLTGRENERKILLDALKTTKPELISVIGRRRVGKTFLVRRAYKENLIFELSGEHEAGMKVQLTNFVNALNEYSVTSTKYNRPDDWTGAFIMLKGLIQASRKKTKKVVFIDEFPWLDSPRSGFLSAFEYFWNSWASKKDDLVIVICGSSASWMIKKVLNNRGGLYNRITRKIRLLPFTLRETELFFRSNNINLSRFQISQIYMILGGIPFYLGLIEKGESATLFIDRVCFSKDGMLTGEFTNLYQSLFKETGKHLEIIRSLSRYPEGITRSLLSERIEFISGGRFTETLSELEESGFITSYVPFGKKSGHRIFKITDEFSFFYLKFIDQTRITGTGTWIKLSSQHRWKIWCGYAWERMCLKHVDQIKEALGISGVLTTQGIWRSKGNKSLPGAQIDLYINRSDNCINICEAKYYDSEYIIDKKNFTLIKNKIDLFREETRTDKTLFLTFITLNGVKENQYSLGFVQNTLTLDSLFGKG